MTPAVLVVVAVLFSLGLAEESKNPTFDAASKLGSAVFQTWIHYQKAVSNGNDHDAAKLQEELFEMRPKIIQIKNDLADHPNPEDGTLQYSPEAQDILMDQLKMISTNIDQVFLNTLKKDSCPFLVDTKKELDDNVNYRDLEKEIAKKFEIPRGMVSLIEHDYEKKREDDAGLPPLNNTKLNELMCKKWRDLDKNVTIETVEKAVGEISEEYINTSSTDTTTPPPRDQWGVLLKKLKDSLRSIDFKRIEKVVETLKARYKNNEENVPYDKIMKKMIDLFEIPNKAVLMYRVTYDTKREEAEHMLPPKLTNAFLERIVWHLWKGLGERVLNEEILNKTIAQLSRIKKF